MKRFLFGLMAWVFVAVNGTPATASEQLDLVATTGMVGDVVRAVAGDHARVKVLVGEGVDPHLYSPRSSDVRAMLNADGVYYTGLMFEGRMGEALKKTAERGREVVAIAEAIPTDQLLREGGTEVDPHVWMDVALWSGVVGVVQQSLCQLDPANCETYTANARRYQDELKQLDAYVKMVIDTIPPGQRVLVTAHDAFGYFGRSYGVEVRGVQGISTESEAGLADINALVRFLVKRHIPAIFIESSIPEKNIRALQEGAAAADHSVTVGGELYADSMGAPGSWTGTYIGMMDHNANTIAGALAGKPVEGGFRAWKKSRRDSSSSTESAEPRSGGT
ncbi:MAG: zinc ABC transporter substrate-binding protein [Phycisphaerales bacterium]|nr:zinc ABC transporter substrate-binding protein [Phycisphaerales bacterium]